ncbi:MAG: rod shape-determining protein MreD [Microcoleaceae cyanobacterium]
MFSPKFPLYNGCIVFGSAIFCTLLMQAPMPWIEVFDIGPNWILIWLVTWSIKRPIYQAAIGGLALGLVLDGMSSPVPTHIYPMVIVGTLTVLLYRVFVKKIQEDFISVALIVFGMAILFETMRALQFSQIGDRALADLWVYQQQVALSSAILSSLWAPVIHFPLHRWWRLIKAPHPLKSKV